MFMGKYKIRQSEKELVKFLKRHIKLLSEYYVRAFVDHDESYYGEIAGKLRLLVYNKGQDPLLVKLMKQSGVEIPVTLGGPPIKRQPSIPRAGDEISLERYLELLACVVRTPKGLVKITKIDLIKIWAQQDGSSHQGWQQDEAYVTARDLGLFIGGVPAIAAELKATTDVVLHVANKFIAIVDKNKIDVR